MMTRLSYPIAIELLPSEDGGGFLALVPHQPGCMSDGASSEEAVANSQNVINTWIEAANDLGHAIPERSPHLILEPAR